MYVSYYKGSQAIVSYHGSTDQYARRMQVLIDGRSVYLAPASTVDWANLPVTVDDIERIEVIRGPAAASHGANSTQGVISITTRDAGVTDGKSVTVTHGSKGINDVSARFGKHGDTLDYRMTLAYNADNGYDSLTVPPNNYPVTQFKAAGLLGNSNDSNQARLFNYRADYHPNGVDRYDIQAGFNHDTQGVGFNDKNPSLSNPKSTNGNTFHDLISNSGFLQIGWIRSLDDGAEFSLRYYHIRQDQHEMFPVYLNGVFYANPVVQSTQSTRDEIEVQHTLPLSSANRLVYGAAYRTDRSSGQSYIPPLALNTSSSANTSEFRLFAHDEWRFTPKLLLNVGAMSERDGMGHQNVSPRAAVNFHVTPQHTLRMGVSVAYRTPSLVENNYPAVQAGTLFIPSVTVTSPGLAPERLLSREIGYLGEFPAMATSLDLRLFNDQLSDGIYVSSTRASFVNGFSAQYRGFEATLKHAFGENSDLTVNFAHELASSNGPALGAAGQRSLSSSNPLNNDILSASTPKNSASLLYSQRLFHDYSASVAYYRQDAMQPFDRGAIDYQPIQRRMDVRIAKSFNDPGTGRGDVALVVQNLFDHGYTEYIASNVFNRRVYATLTLHL
jgi:iron complex outermembrane receptor protein